MLQNNTKAMQEIVKQLTFYRVNVSNLFFKKSNEKMATTLQIVAPWAYGDGIDSKFIFITHAKTLKDKFEWNVA